MSFEPVYAHAPGQSAAVLSPKHNLLLTTGPDLLLNAFPLLTARHHHAISTADAPAETRPHSTSCSSCLAADGDIVVSGSGGGEVVVLRLPDLQFDRVAMQFGLGVRAVAVSSGARYIAAAGDECKVKVVEGGSHEKSLNGHTARVTALAISEKAPLVASLASNGEVKLWRIVGDDDTPVAKAKVGKAAHEWNACISYSKDGVLLAVPDAFGVTVFDDALSVIAKLADKSGAVVGCVYSRDFLFAFRTSGTVDVYNKDTHEHLHTATVCNCAILSLAVSGDQRTIYTVDEEGNARSGTINIQLQPVAPVVKPAVVVESASDTNADSDANASSDANADSDANISSDANASSDDQGQDVEMAESREESEKARHEGFTPFSPNNTPFDENSRYLAWNAIGKVIARREPIAGTVSIDVDFADSRHHRPIRFTDDYRLTMAHVDDAGCVFASECALLHMPTGVGGGWSLRVNTVLEVDGGGGERIVSVACNHRHIYCLTNEHLRIINTSGCQLAVVPIPGRPLCVTANQKYGVVVYGEEGTVKSMLFEGTSTTTTAAVTKHQPVWMGPSLADDCELFGLLDCSGNFYVTTGSSPNWTLLHHPQHHDTLNTTLWPIFFTTKHIHAVLLHDSASQPDILPVPLVSQVPFTAPLLANPFESAILKLAGNAYVDQLMAPLAKDARVRTAADKNVLELIQIAIKMDHHQRALDLHKMLFSTRSRELAVQLAQHARASALVERMAGCVCDTVDCVDDGQHGTQELVVEPKAKRRLYVPEEDTQLPVISQDSIPAMSQDRPNPFAKPKPLNSASGENYVNVLEKLSKY